jgi:4-amino-4-deoxy-L-arabinose transferase-like glycosyltransferase
MMLGLALGLRVWGIGFGLPYDFTYDEVHEIVRAFKLGAGEYAWQGFSKGGLFYLLFVEYGLLYVVWRLTGRIADARDFALIYFQDPSVFYLAGRLTVALMGVATCLVVFLLARRVYDWRVGLGATAIGATAYYHGVWSHYINVDIGMTLALWASIWAYLWYEHNQ